MATTAGLMYDLGFQKEVCMGKLSASPVHPFDNREKTVRKEHRPNKPILYLSIRSSCNKS